MFKSPGMVVIKCILAVLLFRLGAAYDGKYREEGDACGAGDAWTCKNLGKCPSAQLKLKSGGASPLVCSVVRGVPIVCCPPSDTTEPEDRTGIIPDPKAKASISKKMCEKYSKFVFTTKRIEWFGPPSKIDECGRIEQALIINGKNASLREFPHMAQIGYWYRERILYVCGGSLISERWVLSAAHCTEAPTFGKAAFVLLGELDTSSENDGARPEVLRIIERINHDGWTGVELYNDIALYKLEKDVKLNSYIRPICLQVEHDFKSPSVLATGWGHTKWEGVGSKMLQKAWLDQVDNPQCSKQYGTQFQIPQGIVETKMICTLGKQGEDTCQGDSGGPIQIPIASPYCMYSQVGVTSFGIECGSKFPGVFTRVSHYVPWIEKHVWPDVVA